MTGDCMRGVFLGRFPVKNRSMEFLPITNGLSILKQSEIIRKQLGETEVIIDTSSKESLRTQSQTGEKAFLFKVFN